MLCLRVQEMGVEPAQQRPKSAAWKAVSENSAVKALTYVRRSTPFSQRTHFCVSSMLAALLCGATWKGCKLMNEDVC